MCQFSPIKVNRKDSSIHAFIHQSVSNSKKCLKIARQLKHPLHTRCSAEGEYVWITSWTAAQHDATPRGNISACYQSDKANVFKLWSGHTFSTGCRIRWDRLIDVECITSTSSSMTTELRTSSCYMTRVHQTALGHLPWWRPHGLLAGTRQWAAGRSSGQATEWLGDGMSGVVATGCRIKFVDPPRRTELGTMVVLSSVTAPQTLRRDSHHHRINKWLTSWYKQRNK